MQSYRWRRNERNTFMREMITQLQDVIDNEAKRAPYKDLLPLLHLPDKSLGDHLQSVINLFSKVKNCNDAPAYWQCDSLQYCDYCLSAFRYRLLTILDALSDSSYDVYFRRHRVTLPRGIVFKDSEARYMLQGSLHDPAHAYGYLLKPFQTFVSTPDFLSDSRYGNDMLSLYSATFEGFSMYDPRTDAYTFNKDVEAKRKSDLDKLILKGGGVIDERQHLWNDNYFHHSIIRTLEMERRAITTSRDVAGSASRITVFPAIDTNSMCLELQSVILSPDSLEEVLPYGLCYMGPKQARRRIKLNVISNMYATSSVTVIKKTMRTSRSRLWRLLESTFMYAGSLNNLTPLEAAIYTLGMSDLRTVSTSGLFR